MAPLHVRITIQRSGLTAGPLGFAVGRQPYTVQIEGPGTPPGQEVELTWDESAEKILQDLAFPSDARVERAGAWVAGLIAKAGWPAIVTAILAEVQAGHSVEILVVSDAPEILALPWGLLPVGHDRLRSLSGLRIRRTSPTSAPPPDHPANARAEGRIALAFSPAGGRVSEASHVEAIQRACADAQRPLDPAADVLADASLEGIGRWLRRAREHGEPIRALLLLCRTAPMDDGQLGLVLHSQPGVRAPSIVAAEDLARVLAPHADMVRMVVLSTISDTPPPPGAWRGLGPAAAIHAVGVPAVIGARMPLSRSGSALALGAITTTLISGIGSAQAALSAARQALSEPEDARDQAALCLFADDTHAGLRPLLRRPWPGLAPFDASRAGVFCGREGELDALHDTLEGLRAGTAPRMMILAGSSGSGKTSLAQAGLVPRLHEAGDWRIRTLRPTGDVSARLGAAIGESPTDGTPLLVLVDPFESVFDLPPSARQRLVRALWRQASTPGGSVSVLLCLRIEYLRRCGELVVDDAGTRLDAIAFLDSHQIILRDPSPRALRTMLTEPAARAGLELEPALAHQLANAVTGLQPPLPHLAAATARMWAARTGRRLTEASWRAIGDPSHAVAHLADHVLEGLPPERRGEALRVLRALAAPADTDGPARSIWQTRAHLRPHAGADEERHHDATVAHLIQGGLLRDERGPEGPGLTLAHDHLVAGWSRLLTPSAATVAVAPPLLTDEEPRPARRKRPRRRLPAWPFVLVSVLALLVTAGVLAWGSGARQARRDADAALDAATDVREDPTRAALLLRMGAEARDRPMWTRLANATLHETLSQGVLSGLDGPVDALQFSPDGDRVLTLSGGIPAVWSVAKDTEPLARAGSIAGSGVVAAAFRPDGGAVLLVTRSGVILEWDPDGGDPRRTWSPEATSTTAAAVAISGTGSHVLVANESGWSIVDHTGATIAQGEVPDEDGVAPGAPTAAAIDEDGTRWAIAGRDGRIHLWNSELPDPARIRHPGVTRIEINAKGSHLLSLGDGRLRLTDLTHMRGVTRTPTPVQVHAASFSPIGRHILVDYTHRDTGAHHARTLSVDLRTEQFETEALRVPATALLVDETRDRLLRGREDGRVEELDRRDGRVLRVLRGHRGRVTALRTSPDGRWLASAAADQTVRIWSNREPEPRRLLPLPSALSTAEQVTLTDDGTAWLAQLASRGWVTLPLDHTDLPLDAAEAPDPGAAADSPRGTRSGRILAADGDGIDAFELGITGTCASANGRWIGAVSQVGEVARWDRETGTLLQLGSAEPAPRRCRISNDGGTMMTRGRVEVQVWRADVPGAPVLRARAAPEQDGPTAQLTANGDTLLTLDEAGSVRRWTLDPVTLRDMLWGRSPTCGGTPADAELESFCACEACFGRHPAACESESEGAKAGWRALTDPGVCPGS